jgi:hypothetical protein
MVLIYWTKSIKALIEVSREVGAEGNTEKTKKMVTSRDQKIVIR